MSALLLLLIGLPAVAGALLCVVGHRADRVAGAVSVSVAVVVLVLSVPLSIPLSVGAPGTTPTVALPLLPTVAGGRFALVVDPLTAVILPVVAAVTLLVLAFAVAENARSGKDTGDHTDPARFHGLMLLFLAAVLTTLTATNLVTLLLAWEVMGAASWALIGFSWRETDRVSAGLTAFVTTRTADLGLYLAAGAALAGGGSLTLADLPGLPAGWRDLAAAGILVAALGKAAQLPFSFWLARAMAGPSTVSALLHSAAMVAMGGYLLLRVQPLLAATGWAPATTAWAGALTALLLGVVALAQEDLKLLLAASTAAQLGFIVLAAGVGDVAGGTAHLMAHALTKSGLFLAAGAWLAALGTKRLTALVGAGRRWPVLGVAATVAALALAGVAPLSLWATKDDVLAAAARVSTPLYVTGLVAAALSAAYAGKAVALLWLPQPADAEAGFDTEEEGTRRVSAGQQVPVVLLAVGAAFAGLLVVRPIGLPSLLPGSAGAEAAELVLSAVIAVVVLVLVVVARGRYRVTFRLPLADGWLGLERAADVVLVRPVLALARGLAAFDDRVLDRAVDRAATVALESAGSSGRVDARVDAAVGGVAAGVRRTARRARRPQTGLIHQYYAQAAVALIVVVLVLIFWR
ncbi:NADH dehydrogenase [Tersicoccus phoenicis]|uniref:NADH dehydrogenase n=1 Tax=Tersicoccus phoenicis TaxID=554083 RepID=A0A1R1L7C6_9MICC|nr:proton-conducting transporter membrane subunit [Tersicoccus phoenicis]OMH23452.1 NADH dehydrogenase [Tersicoccus phoenicis]